MVWYIFTLDEEKLDPDIELERILSLAQQQQHTQLLQQHTPHSPPELQDAYQLQVISTEQTFEKSVPEGKHFIQQL